MCVCPASVILSVRLCVSLSLCVSVSPYNWGVVVFVTRLGGGGLVLLRGRTMGNVL